MPKFVHVTNEEVSAITEEGFCSKETVQRRNRAMENLKEFAASKETPLDINEIINQAKTDDIAPLEEVLEHFFAAFRVGPKDELPKKNTVDVYRCVPTKSVTYSDKKMTFYPDVHNTLLDHVNQLSLAWPSFESNLKQLFYGLCRLIL